MPRATGSSRCPRSTASTSACCRASSASATSCSPTPSASPTACRPTTRCCGARAAWARARWSRRSTPRSTRRTAARARAGRDPPRGHPHPAAPAGRPARDASGASCCSATICPSTASDARYKSLKAVLEGGIEGRPDNVVFYATSNRRHLMPRDMIENERSTAINPGEAVEEKVSLSDRFGLWLGFHTCDQDTYFAMIEGYARHLRPRGRARGAAGARPTNGRSRAAPARAASPGSSSRTSPAGSASRW